MRDYSNYHTQSKDKIKSDGSKMFQMNLDGLDAYDVIIDGVPSRVIIQDRYSKSTNVKKIIMSGMLCEVGNQVEWNNQMWLITAFESENFEYKVGTIQLCNTTLPYQVMSAQTISGYDAMGRPIYTSASGSTLYFPCITQSRLFITSMTDQERSINLPEGGIMVTVSYQHSPQMKSGQEYKLYGDLYVVSEIDFSQVIDDKGIVNMVVKKKV